MKQSIGPWLRFFRLPNLATAPGDALAGAAFALSVSRAAPGAGFHAAAFGAAFCALLLYMLGLADNDIAGAREDRVNAPARPIPSGEISLRAACAARAGCLALAAAAAFFWNLPASWWRAAAALALVIMFYNRVKNQRRRLGFILMGLCRGLSLVCGACAALGARGFAFWAALACAALGWTLYTAAVTWLAADEHRAETGLDFFRFIPGMAVFIPLAALRVHPVAALPALALGSLAAYAAWARAVAPLGAPHTPESRRRAVGGAVGALLWLQAGAVLSCRDWRLALALATLFIAKAAIRRIQPNISGS